MSPSGIVEVLNSVFAFTNYGIKKSKAVVALLFVMDVG